MSEKSSSKGIEIVSVSEIKKACEAVDQAAGDIRALSNGCGALSILQGMLESRDINQIEEALSALRHLEPNEILELVPPIYRLTESNSHYFSAVRVMGMVPAKKLRRALVPLVFERLMDPDNDYDYYSWRVNVMVLEYYGFDEEARQVVVLALANDDPEVREVGAEMIAELASEY